MKKLDPMQYPEPIRECWAVHQAFRALGFAPEEIYVAIGKDARHPQFEAALFVVLRAQGKEFLVTLDGYASEAAAEAAVNQWEAFATFSNDGTFDEGVLKVIYDTSNVIQNKVEFITALYNKGIRPSREWS